MVVGRLRMVGLKDICHRTGKNYISFLLSSLSFLFYYFRWQNNYLCSICNIEDVNHIKGKCSHIHTRLNNISEMDHFKNHYEL